MLSAITISGTSMKRTPMACICAGSGFAPIIMRAMSPPNMSITTTMMPMKARSDAPPTPMSRPVLRLKPANRCPTSILPPWCTSSHPIMIPP